ncbi:MAG: hypothetical protein H7A32_01410 [Deltaproteobacteria bacterium]|nr:hypothetical protein [Deltaproteobacteria bacterium]
MRCKLFSLLTSFFILFSFSLHQAIAEQTQVPSSGYDKTWYIADFWPGEYPNALAITEKNLLLPARKAMDKKLSKDVQCQLPYKAVFHHWNRQRNEKNAVKYYTANKIVTLIAKEDFTLEHFEEIDGGKTQIKKGEKINYLTYLSEGTFSVKIKGQEYTADQELFKHVKKVDKKKFISEEWLELRCENGPQAWILHNELYKKVKGLIVYQKGFARGSIEAYGKARDLTDEDLKEIKKLEDQLEKDLKN